VLLQIGEFVGDAALIQRPIGAGHSRALRLNDHRQRQHAAAADTAEEIGFGASHGAALLRSTREFKLKKAGGA
jgi:hypothetical protein